MVVSSASVFTIIAISVERYRVVCKPLSITRESATLIRNIIILIWIISVILSLPLSLIAKFKDSKLIDGTPIKVCRLPINTSLRKSYILSLTVVNFVLPGILLFILYVKLCRKLTPNPNNPIEICDRVYNDKLRLRRQVINILASIVFIFFVCHLPYRVVSVWLIYATKTDLSKVGFAGYLTIMYFARVMFYINHLLNPIVYNIVSKSFRETMKAMFLSRGSHKRRYSRGSQRTLLERRSKVVGRRLEKHKKSLDAHTDENNDIKMKSLNSNDKRSCSHSHSSSSSGAGSATQRQTSGSATQRQRMNDFCTLYKKINTNECDDIGPKDDCHCTRLYLHTQTHNEDNSKTFQKCLILQVN